jgi:phosphoribosyl 1,2-cyclic phosphodiesterase
MTATFTVLASGSSGNATLIRSGSFGLLIDLGLGPRTLTRRLAEAGFGWDHISAVVLTHTHADHWRDTSFAHLSSHGRPVYCHESHRQTLLKCSRSFGELDRAGLVDVFNGHDVISPGGGLRLKPLELRHDSHRTFGFRIECDVADWAAAYVADLGDFDEALADVLCDLDLLALELNHDIAMQRHSGRPWELIERNLGPHGHLSNCQAAQLLASAFRRGNVSRLKQLVALHLSRECNTRDKAGAAAAEALRRHGSAAAVYLACHDRPSPTLAMTASLNGQSIAGRMTTGSLFPEDDTSSPAAGNSTPPRET